MTSSRQHTSGIRHWQQAHQNIESNKGQLRGRHRSSDAGARSSVLILDTEVLVLDPADYRLEVMVPHPAVFVLDTAAQVLDSVALLPNPVLFL